MTDGVVQDVGDLVEQNVTKNTIGVSSPIDVADPQKDPPFVERVRARCGRIHVHIGQIIVSAPSDPPSELTIQPLDVAVVVHHGVDVLPPAILDRGLTV